MNSQTSSKKTLKTIPISVVGSPPPGGPGSAASRPSPAEEWKSDKADIARLCKEGDWPEILKILTRMSTKHKNKEIYKALAQRVWVALKSDAPAVDVVLALFHLLNTLTPRHEIAGSIATLAHLMAKHRTPDHPDRDLALGQAQQMMALVCDQAKVVGQEAFKIWVTNNRLDDPDHYIPIVMAGLEMMVGDDWWIDKEALQRDMEQSRAAAS